MAAGNPFKESVRGSYAKKSVKAALYGSSRDSGIGFLLGVLVVASAKKQRLGRGDLPGFWSLGPGFRVYKVWGYAKGPCAKNKPPEP